MRGASFNDYGRLEDASWFTVGYIGERPELSVPPSARVHGIVPLELSRSMLRFSECSTKGRHLDYSGAECLLASVAGRLIKLKSCDVLGIPELTARFRARPLSTLFLRTSARE